MEGAAAAPPPFEVQRQRSEQFSSSLLESVAPPAMPQFAESIDDAAEDVPDTAESVPPFEPEIAPLSALVDVAPPTAARPTVPSSVSEDIAATSEAVPTTQPMGYDGPIPIEEAEASAPFSAPFGPPSPLPALVSDAPPPAPVRSRRRSYLIAGAGAVGIAAIGIFGVRAASHTPDPAQTAAAAATVQTAPVATTAPSAVAAPQGVAAAAPQVAAPPPGTAAAPATSASSPPSSAKAKPAAKAKAVGAPTASRGRCERRATRSRACRRAFVRGLRPPLFGPLPTGAFEPLSRRTTKQPVFLGHSSKTDRWRDSC